MIEIKHLTSEDLPAAVELDRLCFGGLWTLDGYRRELESPNSDLLGLWIEGRRKREEGRGEEVDLGATTGGLPLQENKLIGLACLWAILGEGHITMLGIHPEYQGQSLGKTLLYHLLKLAHQRQLEWATLEVRASNLVAISLYQKFGFKEAGRRPGYYQEPEEDALILWRSGLQRPEFEEDLTKSIAKSV